LATLYTPTPVTPVNLIEAPEDTTPGTPEWWLYELLADLDRRASLVWLYEDYYEGRHKLTFASSEWRDVFGQMLAAVSDNWIPLVINAGVERLRPQGFLFGGSEEGDEEAWRIWQTNSLDAESPLAFTEAAKHGESYMLVWPDTDTKPKGIFGRLFSKKSEEPVPRITVEHPSQMVVRRSAGDRRKRAAALKRWQEPDGSEMATLYLPDSIHYFTRTEGEWKTRADFGVNKLGVVPVVPIVNEPHMLPCFPSAALQLQPHNVSPGAAIGLGRSDQADVITTVDQINKLLCDMLIASEVAAYRQRWATGLEVPRFRAGDPEVEVDPTLLNKPIEPFKAAVDRVWIAEGEAGAAAKFGEFEATDLQNYTGAIEQRIQSLAARTRTPPHYLLGQIVNVSGDALKAAETGLASKVRGKQASFGEGLEEAVRLAFAWMDDDRATDIQAQVSWAPSEARSESEYIDSLTKKLALGVPKEQLWADAGYSPQQITRFKDLLKNEINAVPEPAPDPNKPTPEPPAVTP